MTPKEVAAAMRKMADVIEQMPPDSRWCASILSWPNSADDFRSIARVMVPFTKCDDPLSYEIERRYGPNQYIKASISRAKICVKRKVIKEVEEYVCEDSLLDPTPATESEVPA